MIKFLLLSFCVLASLDQAYGNYGMWGGGGWGGGGWGGGFGGGWGGAIGWGGPWGYWANYGLQYPYGPGYGGKGSGYAYGNGPWGFDGGDHKGFGYAGQQQGLRYY
eukprot:TRINITY_DN1736_c0_g1_i1.p1 TRINITY_DN1736_c0_g1~~TRINITY_DN1736_c0_g1_i1.p1  ORF type:complete len:106 (-),score=22.55 TRINITY_DN1736_c0_g1_i1:75-392(-)